MLPMFAARNFGRGARLCMRISGNRPVAESPLDTLVARFH
jgi:hypothetical protein